MAPHSSTLAWKIPWTVEPGGLQSMGSLESDTTERLHFHFHALEKERQPTPVFLPGESQGQGSLMGCRLWGRTESDMTEVTQQQQQQQHSLVGKELACSAGDPGSIPGLGISAKEGIGFPL